MQSKREQWAAHVAAWQSSGCSQAQWCREQGLALASFGYWRRKLRAETVPALLPIHLASPSPAPAPAIEIRLAGGISLSVPGADPAWLADLLHALGAC